MVPPAPIPLAIEPAGRLLPSVLHAIAPGGTRLDPNAGHRRDAEERDLPDTGTFERFRAGDPQAFHEIVRLYHVRVIGFAKLFAGRRELAEEVAQEVFVETWHSRARIHSPGALRPWMFTLAKRLALREARRRSHGAEVMLDPEDLTALAPQVSPGQREGLRAADVAANLGQAMNSLSERDRDLVAMRYFGGLSIKELAENFSMPIGSVGTTISRALVRMRREIEARGLSPEDLLP